MKNKKSAIFVLIISLALINNSTILSAKYNSKAKSAAIQIKTGSKYFGHDFHPDVSVTALKNGIRISTIEINRGNCRNYRDRDGSMPHDLNYGETYETVTDNDCNIVEVDVYTNIGKFTYMNN